MGRKAKPTAVLKASGSWRAGLREGEVEPPAGAPVNVLTESDLFTALAREIHAAGLGARCDGLTLGLLVKALGMMSEAEKIFTAEGMTVNSKLHSKIQHPAVKTWMDAWKLVMDAAREFGLSPVARVGLTVQNMSDIRDGKSRFFATGS